MNNYVKEFDSWEELVKYEINERLEIFKGISVYMCDLSDTLFEEENANCTYTFSENKSKEMIKAYFDDFGVLVNEYYFSTNIQLNPFDGCESFIVNMLFEQARNILSQVSIVDELWNEGEMELTQEIIDKIKKELN